MSEECAVKAWRRAVRWLAGRLSEARVLPSWKRCHECVAFSFESCATCWEEAAKEAAKVVEDAEHERPHLPAGSTVFPVQEVTR